MSPIFITWVRLYSCPHLYFPSGLLLERLNRNATVQDQKCPDSCRPEDSSKGSHSWHLSVVGQL